MQILRIRHNAAGRCIATGAMILGLAVNAVANPTGMTVASGSASVHQSGPQLTVAASQNAFLNWQSFNIASGETTIFNQPSASSVVWNRINDPNPSQIFGTLQANGIVVLLNSSGFYFGPNSFVSAAGLVVSTAQCAPPENSGGGWEFNGPPPLASIVNYGRINVGQNGSAFLISDQIENHGTIEAPGGTVGLAAGQTVLLSERPDGRGMSLQVTLPQGSVDNDGKLIADAGTIALNAKVINQDGLLQANSVRNENGVIELVASDSLNLGANSKIIARGDDLAPGSSGGTVTLKSENNFSDNVGSQIITTGGAQGGNGGNVEISAPNIQSLNSTMDANAQNGFIAGEFFLDPMTVILGTASANGVPDSSGMVAYNSAPNTLNLNVNAGGSFNNFSQIILQATGDIYVGNGTVNSSSVFTFAANPGITWNLSSSTGNTSGQLTLEAGGNITFGNNSQIFDANNWSVTLEAGYDFVNNVVQSGIGNIYLNGGNGQTGNGSIEMASGNNNLPAISLTAGQNILVGKGYVITTGGGNINAHALAGNIDTGSDAQGYHFNSSASSINNAYDLSRGLGGISTAAGGNVSLTAGGNVSSVLPGNNGYYYNGNFSSSGNVDYRTAGSGAYGHLTGQAGNVTVVAGGNVTGNYLVANGIGSIYAGVVMDANGNPETDISGNYVLGTSGSAGTSQSSPNLALNLITGGWNVTAAQNIILQEVRNPNGIFDVNGGAAYKHYFDYAPGDYVNLSADNLVQLGASAAALPRADTLNVPVIYPSILNIMTGAGGLSLVGDATFNQLILFPSPEGKLTINTTQGGSLVGNLPGTPQDFNLIDSDSGKSQYKTSGDFGLNDHAATPVHLGNPTPISLNISGDMDLVLLGAPEAAQINIGDANHVSNMNNSRFQGMNLSANDVTSITVTGDINNRGNFTFVDLDQISGAEVPDLSYLSQAVNNSIGGTSISAATLTKTLFYDPVTQTMTYQNINGKSLASVLNLLQNLTVQVYINGVPQWSDAPYNTIPLTTTVSVLNAATAKTLVNQYNADNLASALPAGALPPDGTYGYSIGGGGSFDFTARNMDLGTTAGIRSVGVSLYTVGSSYPLAAQAGITRGADISVNLTGNLDMFSTSIASLNGGNININAGGEVDAGSSEFTVNSTSARGIFSTSQGNVTVVANGDININGSRIATYDGGNLTVESLNGSVDAGNGGNGSVILYNYYVNPISYDVSFSSVTISGSGMIAATFPDSSRLVGNILVETPNGNITANQAGVSQFHLNDVNSPDATVTLLAGYELQNGSPILISPDRDIDVSGSGVIAQNAVLKASGNISGLIFAKGNIDVNAQQNVNVTALAQGNVNASAGGSISGTIVGVGGITASGGSIDASLLSNNQISGATSGQSGFAQGAAASATSQAASNANANQTPGNSTAIDNTDDQKKKKPISLARRVGRVTVLLPTKTD